MKKITLNVAEVFGATELESGIVATAGANAIFRSDYLDKLVDAVKSDNAKYKVDEVMLDIADYGYNVANIVGYDIDHPFVTFEKPSKASEGTDKIYRAWRYIAVVR